MKVGEVWRRIDKFNILALEILLLKYDIKKDLYLVKELIGNGDTNCPPLGMFYLFRLDILKWYEKIK